MKYVFLIVGIGSLILTGSCSKEDAIEEENQVEFTQIGYPRLNPTCWLPCYPGSFWVYDNGDTIFATGWKLDSLKRPSWYSSPDPYEDPYFVPVYNGVEVFGDQVTSSVGTGLTFVFDTVGDQHNAGNQYSLSANQCLAYDTSMMVNGVQYDPVQVVVSWHAQQPLPTWYNTNWYTKKYYAKDVGMIYIENFEGDSIISSSGLVAYFIEH
jgi:hypothetical protein